MNKNIFTLLLVGSMTIFLISNQTIAQVKQSNTFIEQQVTMGKENETNPSYNDKGNLTFSTGGHSASRGYIDLEKGAYLAYLMPAEAGKGRVVDTEYKNESDFERGVWAQWAQRSGDKVEVVEKRGQTINFSTGQMRTYIKRKIVVTQRSNKLEIATNVQANATPSISPDGKFVLFCRDRNDGKGTDIWRVDIESGKSSSPVQLTKGVGNNNLPFVAPDGKTIYFVSDRMGKPDIWMMNFDGSNQRQLTKEALVGAGLAVSPDGSKITFSSLKGISTPTTESGNIWIVNTDASGITKLTSDMKSQWPTFNRDGSEIAYQSFRSGNWDIWLLKGLK